MKKYFIRAILVLVALIAMYASIQDQESFSCDGSTVVVQQGDDVWGLIEKHCTGEFELARSHIVASIGGASIRPGQVIVMSDK